MHTQTYTCQIFDTRVDIPHNVAAGSMHSGKIQQAGGAEVCLSCKGRVSHAGKANAPILLLLMHMYTL